MLLIATEIRPVKDSKLGVFCLEKVSRGSIVWESGFPDVQISESDLNALPRLTQDLIFEYGVYSSALGMWYLCADNARFMNHAPGNEASVRSTYIIDMLNIATRDLYPGDELTIDYSTVCDTFRRGVPSSIRGIFGTEQGA